MCILDEGELHYNVPWILYKSPFLYKKDRIEKQERIQHYKEANRSAPFVSSFLDPRGQWLFSIITWPPVLLTKR